MTGAQDRPAWSLEDSFLRHARLPASVAPGRSRGRAARPLVPGSFCAGGVVPRDVEEIRPDGEARTAGSRVGGFAPSSPSARVSEGAGAVLAWPTLVVLTAAGLYATLPTQFLSGHSSASVYGAVRWVVPVITVFPRPPGNQRAAATPPPVGDVWRQRAATEPSHRLDQRDRRDHRRKRRRDHLARCVVLVTGSSIQARLLLRAGVHMWVMNVLVFSLWFWQLDGGGPVQRRLESLREPDFLFPQQALAVSTGTRWQPRFIDYLFVSYTNATAFSPTDTMPLQPVGEGSDDGRIGGQPAARDHGRRPRCQHSQVGRTRRASGVSTRTAGAVRVRAVSEPALPVGAAGVGDAVVDFMAQSSRADCSRSATKLAVGVT